MATASLILGILSIILAFTGLGIPLGIAGIICALIARRTNPAKAGLAGGGLATSIVGLFLPLALFLACTAGITGAGYCSHRALEMLQQQQQIPLDDDNFMKEMQKAFERGKKEMH